MVCSFWAGCLFGLKKKTCLALVLDLKIRLSHVSFTPTNRSQRFAYSTKTFPALCDPYSAKDPHTTSGNKKSSCTALTFPTSLTNQSSPFFNFHHRAQLTEHNQLTSIQHIPQNEANIMASEAGKNSKWNADSHQALCGALMDVLEAGSVPLAAHKEIIVQSMTLRGHQFTWEGLR